MAPNALYSSLRAYLRGRITWRHPSLSLETFSSLLQQSQTKSTQDAIGYNVLHLHPQLTPGYHPRRNILSHSAYTVSHKHTCALYVQSPGTSPPAPIQNSQLNSGTITSEKSFQVTETRTTTFRIVAMTLAVNLPSPSGKSIHVHNILPTYPPLF